MAVSQNGNLLTVKSTWNPKPNQQNLGGIIRLHPYTDFNRDNADMEEYADASSCCELAKPNEDEIFCSISVECQAGLTVRTVVIIADSSTIEFFGPPSVGYICTSRGELLDEFEGTTIHGHTVDFVSTVLPVLELRVFPLKSQSTIMFFGFHLFTMENSPPSTKIMSNLFSENVPVTSVEQFVPVHILFQKIESLRSDLLSMEERLKAHIDREILALKKELFLRLDSDAAPSKQGEPSS